MKALVRVSAQAAYIPGFLYGQMYDAGLQLSRLKKMKLLIEENSGDDVVLTDPAMRKAVQNVDMRLPNAAEARWMSGKTALESDLAALGKSTLARRATLKSIAAKDVEDRLSKIHHF